MALGSLTAANAVITLTIPGLFNSPVQIQGFTADNVYEMPTVELTQTAMGVDGYLSAGFVFNPIDQTFSIQADSNANVIFDTWAATMLTQRDTFRVSGETTLKSIGRSFICTNGALISWAPAPAAQKILAPRQALIRWQSVTAVVA
ncbi:phage tail fiber protein [Rhizobium rhizogenes]|uniref:phage tail fiber protein n=1 Tax=Rhizobium rhizogenes TaxID=359 RepID=UPI00226D5F2A|nr:hypothetical protein [Rhizobium rhizogenes]